LGHLGIKESRSPGFEYRSSAALPGYSKTPSGPPLGNEVCSTTRAADVQFRTSYLLPAQVFRFKLLPWLQPEY